MIETEILYFMLDIMYFYKNGNLFLTNNFIQFWIRTQFSKIMTQFDFLIARIGLFHFLLAFRVEIRKFRLICQKKASFVLWEFQFQEGYLAEESPRKFQRGRWYAPQEQFNLQQFRLLAAPCILLIDLFPRYNWNKRESRLYLPKDRFEL